MFDLPDSPPGLLSMDPLAGREGTYTLGSNENLGTNLTRAVKRRLSARFSRQNPFFSSARLARGTRKVVLSRQSSATDVNNRANSHELGSGLKSGAKGVLNKFIKQMSVLTLNHANQRKRRKASEGTPAEEADQLSDMPQSVSHSNLSGKSKTAMTTSGSTRKCSTLPARFDYTPGVIGLRNHGNTCFINAILQCLNHTDMLAEYFVTDQYRTDLNRKGRLMSARKFGTRGEVTEQLAGLLKALWSSQYEPEMTFKLKSVIDKYGAQYRGAAQHDAQEFLLWLLDKVHEDLNTATKKKYKKVKNSYGRPDEIVAAETMANHLRCNSSFVHQLFQAQFRSSLTCPHCHKQSSTFDPFLCVSLPIPRKRTQNVFVNVVYLCQQPRQVRLGLCMNGQADVKELREILSSDTGIELDRMLLTEIDSQGFLRTHSDNQPISVLRESDPLYCVELPAAKEPCEEDGAFILLCWINVLVEEHSQTRFGSPYTMQVARETSFEDLQKLLLKEMASIVDHRVLCQKQEGPLFNIRVVDGVSRYIDSPADEDEDGPLYLNPSLDHPLYAEAVDTALSLCDPEHGTPYHIKLVLEWDVDSKEKTLTDDDDVIEEHSSVGQLKASSDDCTSVTLEECFQLYTQAEQLGPEDAWHCPSCNRKQEVVKRLALWSSPDILIVHLKRFKQSAKQRTMSKLSIMIDFPVFGLDLTNHLASRSPTSSNISTDDIQGNNGYVPGWRSLLSPLKRRPSLRPSSMNNGQCLPGNNQPANNGHQNRMDDHVYDLYAVCNHHGVGLVGGHYTAYCRNPTDGMWYLFDDAHVTRVKESEIVTTSAYILFYQRRSLSSSSGSSEASSSSSSSSAQDHWAFRLPRTEPRSQLSASNSRRGSTENFNRKDRLYSTLPANADRRSSSNHLASGEEVPADWSDDDTVALNGDWGTPDAPRRSVSSQKAPH